MLGKQASGGSQSAADPYYVSHARTVENIYNAAVFAIADLKQAGHLELIGPFAEIVVALAKVDTAALKALDDAHEAGQ